MPLIVKGAKQIGKTESILNFSKTYKNVIYINFALKKKYLSITNDGYEVDSIIKNISLLNPEFKFIAFETLIIFDEIQVFPDNTTALKSFAINKEYDVICLVLY